MPTATDITAYLLAWSGGDTGALDKLVPALQSELHRLADSLLRHEREQVSLQATELINEAWLRLIESERVAWEGRAHFFGVAARLMRHILVDHARRRHRLKRGEGLTRLTLDDALGVPDEKDVDLIALDDALLDLERLNARQSRIVELRFFGGLTVEEAAAVMKLAPATVKREWRSAKAWLSRELQR
jgi:RNA polymerase sigma factor (TIGR02999 family)